MRNSNKSLKRLELSFKGLILKVLLFSSWKRAHQGSIKFTHEDKLLLIRLNKIGDALVTTPLIAALWQGTGAELHILADRKNHFVFDGNPAIQRKFIYKKGLGGFLALWRLTRRERYSAVVDLHDDVSTTVSFLLALARTSVKIGFARNGTSAAGSIYTHTVPRPDPALYHVVDRFMAMASVLGLTQDQKEVNIHYYLRPESIEIAREFMATHCPSGSFRVLINISAGSEARFWGVARFQALIAFLKQQAVDVLLTCSPHELVLAEAIGQGAIPIYLQPDFNAFAAIIPEVDLLFTPDTSVVHLASAWHVPVFGLYAGVRPESLIWYPYASVYEAYSTAENTLENAEFDSVMGLFTPFFVRMLAQYAAQKAKKVL